MSGQWWNDDDVDEPVEQPGVPQPGGYVPPAGPSPAASGGDMPTYGAAPLPVGQQARAGGGSGGGGVPWAVAIAAVLALVGGLLVFNSLSGDDEQVVLGGEVVLERADEAGDDPFFDDFATLVSFDPTDITPPNVSAVPVNGQADGTSEAANAAPLTNAEILQLSFKGGEPGLYGGTGDSAACNKAALIAFLETTPEKATAWAGAQGIPASGVREFVEGLTTVALQADTRVTNHGFKNGVANPIQSVLQAGTAVMIDATGIPRVKCGCGNPLRKPIPQTKTVVLKGTPWPAFDQTVIATIEPADSPVDTFVLADARTGNAVERPAGTDGDADTVTNIAAPRPTAELVDVGAAGVVSSALGAAGDSTAQDGELGVGVEEEPAVDRPQDTTITVDEGSADPQAVTPTAPVLSGEGYCAKYQSYVDQASELFFGEDDDGSVLLAFLKAALLDLGSAPPPELAQDWKSVVEYMGTITLVELLDSEEDPPHIQPAFDRIESHAVTECGIEDL